MAAIRPPRRAIGLSLFLLLGGCTWGVGGRDTETTLMHRRFSRTFELQTGIIQGDLEKAKAGAAWLVGGTESESAPTGTGEHLARLRGYAALISQAETIEAAARQTGQLAGAWCTLVRDCPCGLETVSLNLGQKVNASEPMLTWAFTSRCISHRKSSLASGLRGGVICCAARLP